MAGYIPNTDEGKILWLNQFTTWLNANGAAHGFNSVDMNAMLTATTAATTAFTDHETAKAAARAACATKNDAIGAAIALARDDAQRIQTYPTTTDADRANAGITIPDTTTTTTSDDKILTIPAPILLLDFSIRHQVTVHWGPNPANEHQNAKPQGVFGCEIQYVQGETPTEETVWISLGLDTDSPLIHQVTSATPPTYTYRGRYVDKKLKYGNFGDPVKCTVSV